jgi:hypothetical protein
MQCHEFVGYVEAPFFRWIQTISPSETRHGCFPSRSSFPADEASQMIQVRRSDSLKIPCRPPAGVPDPDTYWTDRTQPGGQQYGYRVSNARMQQDDAG